MVSLRKLTEFLNKIENKQRYLLFADVNLVCKSLHRVGLEIVLTDPVT